MRSIVILFVILIFCVNLSAQNVNSSNINDIQYSIKLIKFYIEKNEYDTALEYIDKTLEVSAQKDSLFIFKGFIYKDQEDWLKASECYAKAILYTQDEQLINEVLVDFEKAIMLVSPLQAIDIVSSAVTKALIPQKHTGFLYILASLYENNQLYSEANDVYNTIILEVDESEKYSLQIKIATNSIFQKEYNETLNILKPLIAENDSINNEKLLFLDYIANISLERYEKAKNSLLRLYLEYPNHPNRIEILSGLAEVFEWEQQYLMSWYMLNELYKISNEAQKFKLQNEIEQIKKRIYESNKVNDQFKYLKPVFEEDIHKQISDKE
ncbi:MAG: hypothetical protein P9L97_04560 [Candidatus Tenebribacter davisii]|nr:hypothetical protein [Candidatus Tenebribacter davisii]